MIDYSKSTKLKQIERENAHLYSRLNEIYNNAKQMKSKMLENNNNNNNRISIRCNKDKIDIKNENIRLVNRICEMKPSKLVSLDEHKKSWNLHINFKNRRIFSQYNKKL